MTNNEKSPLTDPIFLEELDIFPDLVELEDVDEPIDEEAFRFLLASVFA